MFHWTIHLEGAHRKDQAAVAVGHQIYCFGGDFMQRGRDHIEVHVFNTVSLCWRKLTSVPPGTGVPHLEAHTAVLIGDTVYLWGGWTNPGYTHCNVLYAFDVDAHTWFKPQVSGTLPKGRYRHSACVLGKVMFVHGGRTMTLSNSNDMYKLDTTTMVWALINTRGTTPPDSAKHSATIIGSKMFVFGGWREPRQYYNTIRVFDTDTNLWMNTPSAQLLPEGRCGHSAFTYNGELYIVGGYGEKPKVLWKYNPGTFLWKKIKPKGEVQSQTGRMCCCVVGDRIILFGGDDTPNDLNVLDFSPSLKTLCKLAVIQHGLDRSQLAHNIRWELAAMTSKSS